MARKGLTIVIVLTLGMLSLSARDKHHYVFTLPSGYVGWVQVVFGDRGAPPLSYEKNVYRIAIRDSGVFRTQTLAVWVGGRDECFYRETDSNGREKLVPVRSDYVIDSPYDGGFGVSGTPDGSPGSTSWFFFIGPPDVRATMPLADTRIKKEKGPLPAPTVYPVPGRMQQR